MIKNIFFPSAASLFQTVFKKYSAIQAFRKPKYNEKVLLPISTGSYRYDQLLVTRKTS